MKFSNVIIATVSLVLLGLVLDAFLEVGFISINNDRLADVISFIIAFLVSSLVVGYVFALRIQENSRIKATGVITVLSTFIAMVFDSIWISTPYGSQWFMEDLKNMFNTSTSWSHYELAAYSALAVSIVAIIGFVIVFIGLYAGSMLRKPAAKTKE